MIVLGLTGSIATGKSTVLDSLAELGAATFSADAAVHELYSGKAVAPVEALFPGVSRDGAIDRQELGRRLTAEPDRLKPLEAVVHPLVRQRLREFRDEAEAAGATLAVVDIPLLFETGFDYGVDKVAVTTAPDELVRARALARAGMSVEKLATILARQLPQAEKVRRADFVIDTSGSLEATRRQVETIVDALRDRNTP